MLVRTFLAGLAAAATVAAAVVPAPVAAGKPLRPVVIWHGLGDNYQSDGMLRMAALIEETFPGTFVHSVYLEEDPEKDAHASLFGRIDDQVEQACEQLAAIPELAKGFDAIGFSQGGVMLRGYIERCNTPKVGAFLTFGTPHNGVADFPPCKPRDLVCRRKNSLLLTQAYTPYVQNRLTVAQYYRKPEELDKYLEYSNYLADINNEREDKNETYAANMAALENFAMVLFTTDLTVVPKWSTWMAEYDRMTDVKTPLEQRPLYTEDWLGLKQLGDSGRLHYHTIEGDHMRIPNDTFVEIIGQYLGNEICAEADPTAVPRFTYVDYLRNMATLFAADA
ncbi:Alpha/Beta hydrolase protein [Dipodascopsis tothii]|uniref:Alpha/Beta hydrolase protein n=1 Tax=Dipodascopsis tothii TaxID=44089 RepID=UPI0034CF6785